MTALAFCWRRQWQPTPVLLPGKSHGQRSLVGCSPWGRWVGHDWVTSLSIFTFHFHALEKEMATHSSVLAWRIPGTGEPGGLQSLGLHRVGHDWSDLVVLDFCYACETGRRPLLSAPPDLIYGFRGYEVMIENRIWWTEQDFCHPKENKLLYLWWRVLACVWWRVGGVPLRLEVKKLSCSSSWTQELSRISFLSPQCKATQYDHSEP